MAKTRYTTDFIPFTGIPKKRNIATAEQTAELQSYFSHTPLPTVEQRLVIQFILFFFDFHHFSSSLKTRNSFKS